VKAIYRISDIKEVKEKMRYGCGGGGGGHWGYGYGYGYGVRSFLTKEEKLALLKEYKEDLEKEVKGVEERIKELSSK
jgi:hypothetical protein